MLARELGEEYRAYRARTPMLLPVSRKTKTTNDGAASGLALAEE